MPKYPNTPEVIGRVSEINGDGEDRTVGERIVTIQVLFGKGQHRDGTAQIDVSGWGKKGAGNLLIEIPLPEFVAALSCATLNRDGDDD